MSIAMVFGVHSWCHAAAPGTATRAGRLHAVLRGACWDSARLRPLCKAVPPSARLCPSPAGVAVILGSTYNGEFEDVKAMDEALSE